MSWWIGPGRPTAPDDGAGLVLATVAMVVLTGAALGALGGLGGRARRRGVATVG